MVITLVTSAAVLAGGLVRTVTEKTVKNASMEIWRAVTSGPVLIADMTERFTVTIVTTAE